ncbi:MAG TPA: efflux RND transporter periplasmic adaptor subunit [Verrucomicrobiae bacterium]|jgi:RND family efflux transporter MFP subunit|nr:efflux RND transporter periplasmic adaptor subunit [Verrucomicrobiae bacterium]
MKQTELEPAIEHSPAATPHGAELGASGGAPPAPAGRMPLFILGAFGVLLLVAAGLTVLSKSRASAELESDTVENVVPAVSVVHPKRTPAQIQLELPGNITAFEEAPIYARVSGYLKEWYTDIGTRVVAGQPLAEIETPELDQEVKQANAALALASANLEIARISSDRWQNLRKSDSVSQQDTDVRVATWHAQQANVEAQEANVQRLKELSNFKKLVAPFPGTITVRTMDAGTLITAGSSREIFRLARIDPLRVYISLPQAYSQMVKTNDEAVLTFAELPGQKFTGKVDRTAGAIDPVSRTLLTEILVSNHDGKLFPGAHTMVQVNLATGVEPVIVPVNTLLFRNEQGEQVGVVDSNGIVRLADVTVGRDYGTTVEIVNGLSEKDNVIINPSDSLEPGVKVRVAKPETDAAAPNHE